MTAQQTLEQFVKGLPERKGIEKNLWVKTFIKKIDYSKEEIAVTIYYKRGVKDLGEFNLVVLETVAEIDILVSTNQHPIR